MNVISEVRKIETLLKVLQRHPEEIHEQRFANMKISFRNGADLHSKTPINPQNFQMKPVDKCADQLISSKFQRFL